MTERSAEFYFESDPEFPPDVLEALSQNDVMPAIFEWYKHVGLTVHHVACLIDQSPAFRLAHSGHWAVLRGMLHRCCRLMLANVALTHKGVFGDAAKIFDRCIFETTIKVRWLCQSEEFQRYLASSLKPERDFKARLLQDIASQNGTPTPIQDRMLASMERHRRLAGVEWEEVQAAKKLPPLDSMMASLGIDPLGYMVSQQIGSHAIHASWPSLLSDYLVVEDDDSFGLRDHDVEPHPAQFAAAILQVLEAAVAVVRYSFQPQDGDGLADDIAGLRDRFRDFYLQHQS